MNGLYPEFILFLQAVFDPAKTDEAAKQYKLKLK